MLAESAWSCVKLPDSSAIGYLFCLVLLIACLWCFGLIILFLGLCSALFGRLASLHCLRVELSYCLSLLSALLWCLFINLRLGGRRMTQSWANTETCIFDAPYFFRGQQWPQKKGDLKRWRVAVAVPWVKAESGPPVLQNMGGTGLATRTYTPNSADFERDFAKKCPHCRENSLFIICALLATAVAQLLLSQRSKYGPYSVKNQWWCPRSSKNHGA